MKTNDVIKLSKIGLLLMFTLLVILLVCMLLELVLAESINESILITLNNSTDWRTNLSMCCDWMG